MSARQQITETSYGRGLSTLSEYNDYGYSVSSEAKFDSNDRQHHRYSFDPVTGNLNWRKDSLENLTESFTYDNLNRLETVTGPQNLTMDYAANGNILTKSDVGTNTFEYNHPTKPYALTDLKTASGLVPEDLQLATYTSFEQVSTIEEGDYYATFTYNSDDQRAKMLVTDLGSTILTRWYVGSRYIKETEGAVTKEYTWIGGDAYTAPVVAITQSGSTSYYYLLRDYLGNITHQVNTSNTVVAEYSYDAWGRRRDKDDWSYTLSGESDLLAGRGFTSHEWLPWFNLYNMNGRLYDPVLGRFLSPDNYVQMPDNTQNFNRYSYCLNNPLIYTDPDGEIIFTIIGALLAPVTGGASLAIGIAMDVGGIINTASNWGAVKNGFEDNTWKGIGKMFGFYGVGGGQVAASYYLGPLKTIKNTYGGDALNSLIRDGTFDHFDPDQITQNLAVEIAVSQLGLGNKAGDIASNLFRKEISKNLVSNLVSQNVDGIISEIGIGSINEKSFEKGVKKGLKNYSENWWKYSLSGLGQGYMETADTRTKLRKVNAEQAIEYYKRNSTMTGFEFTFQPDTWLESIYNMQTVVVPYKNPRLYSPARNFRY